MIKLVYISRGLRNYRITFLAWFFLLNKKEIALYVFLEEGKNHDYALIERLENLGVRFTYFKNLSLYDKEGFKSKWFNIYFSCELLKKLLSLKPDLILQEGVGGHGLVSLLVKLFKGSRIIVSYERTEHTERYENRFKRIYKSVYFKFFCWKTFVTSKESKVYVEKLNVQRPILLPLNAFLPHLKGIKSIDEKLRRVQEFNTFKIIFVGQLIERKGIKSLSHFINAIEKFSSFNIKIEIIGNGYLESFINGLTQKTYKKVIVDFKGSMAFNLVQERIKDSDILILPTLEDNYALVIQEAINLNTLPFTTKYNGAWNQLIEPFFNEFYYDLNDYQKNVASIEQIFTLKNSELLRNFFENGQMNSAYRYAKTFSEKIQL